NYSYGNVGTSGESGTYIAKDVSKPIAPVNHLGARARVYWDGGTLCQRTATRYNGSQTWSFDVSFLDNCGGYVYSKGFTLTWNGIAYISKNTYRTVNWYG